MLEILSFPSLIDLHTHCRQPGGEHKETLETATKAAAAGGYTMIFDMPNTPVPTISAEALQQKIDLAAGKVYVDVGFHFGAIISSLADFEAVRNQVVAYKLYMSHTTGNLLVDNPDEQEEIFAKCPPEKILMVHAEGDAFARAILLAKKYRRRTHMCHLSRAEEVKMVRSAKDADLLVTSEVTPHHLFLTAADERALGPYGLMRPPLASWRDQQALWQGLKSGVIDMISSDHAPHTKEEKESTKPPFGVPGLETTLPLMLAAIADKKLTFTQLAQLTYFNPRRIFKLPFQGRANVLIDLNYFYTISNDSLFTRCGWTPFEGMEGRGKVLKVTLRNQVIFENGKLQGPPTGKIISP